MRPRFLRTLQVDPQYLNLSKKIIMIFKDVDTGGILIGESQSHALKWPSDRDEHGSKVKSRTSRWNWSNSGIQWKLIPSSKFLEIVLCDSIHSFRVGTKVWIEEPKNQKIELFILCVLNFYCIFYSVNTTKNSKLVHL